jgi:ribosomal protein S6
MNADIDPQNLPELERNLKLSTTVLRYLLIRPER